MITSPVLYQYHKATDAPLLAIHDLHKFHYGQMLLQLHTSKKARKWMTFN